MPAIKAQNLNKIYAASAGDPPKHALIDFNLEVPKGSFFALLGPNGAGKSTFINMMAGLVIKTSGDILIDSYDIVDDMRQARRAIGIVPQELNLDPFFTPAQILDVQAGLYGVPKAERRTMELLDMVGLADKAGAYTRALSGGMLRRLLVAKAMVHSPQILVLDEPTAGVDVELRHMLWEQMKRLNKEGTTIMLTTHYLEEAQELCDEIAIIDQGKLIMKESKNKLMQNFGNRELLIQFSQNIDSLPPTLDELNGTKEGEYWVFRYAGGENQSGKILHQLISQGLTIQSLQTQEAKLEDIFISLTHRH
ncbi:MAG: ATP-binding cassette domain-containing protein [Alphaproteobacteria bacterium]